MRRYLWTPIGVVMCFVWAAGCGDDSGDPGTDTADTAADTADTSADTTTGDTSETADTSDTADSTGDTDSSDTADTNGDTADTADSTGDTTTDTVVSWAPNLYTTYNASGTRLTAKAVTDNSGNSAVMGFDDATLGVRCGVQVASDGASYCLPESLDIERLEGLFYLDDGCTMPALVAPASCGAPAYAHYRHNRYRATPVANTMVWRSRFGGGCDAFTVSGSQSVYSLAQIDLQTLVAFPVADETVHTIDAAIGVRVRNGTDGTAFADAMYDRAVGRIAAPARVAGPLDDDGVPTEEIRLVPRNPFQGGITSYLRYDCAVDDLRFANAFLAEVVDPVPAYVEVLILPANLPPDSSRFRKITNTQTTYCDSGGVERQVGANQLLYVLGAGAADLSGQPILSLTPGTGSGTNHRHYLTADETPIIAEMALSPVDAVIDVGGVAVKVADLGGALKAIPETGLRGYWDQSFDDNSCGTPLADDRLMPGDLLATLNDGGLGSCPTNLAPGLPSVRSLWQVNDETPSEPQTWRLVEQAGVLFCEQREPPRERVYYRGTTPVTSDPDSLLPALSVESL